MCMGWLEGVKVHDFVDVKAKGVFQGHVYNGADLTPIHLQNHVREEHRQFVDTQIASYVDTGVVAPWSEVADITIHPKPRMVMPLGVEPSKPRAFLDARYLNLMCEPKPFTMDGAGKVAQIAWQGAFQMTCDHKAGFHHVALDKASWECFGFEWGGKYFVFTTLCFGWCSSPFIYHTLSAMVARYLRTKGMPVLTWIDDFYFTNFRATRTWEQARQFQAAKAAAYLVMSVFYKAGYFVSIKKCELEPTTSIVFLGVRCDSALQRFIIPEDKFTSWRH